MDLSKKDVTPFGVTSFLDKPIEMFQSASHRDNILSSLALCVVGLRAGGTSYAVHGLRGSADGAGQAQPQHLHQVAAQVLWLLAALGARSGLAVLLVVTKKNPTEIHVKWVSD